MQTGSLSNTVTTDASLVERDSCNEASLGGASHDLKPVVEGGGCVHTQTGSMSNTVTTEASLVERDNCTKDSLGGMGDVTKPGVEGGRGVGL